MKCVILPGKEEEGGPPTKLEIEKIENRYQLQSDGKSEYYGFDRALSIQRKILIGLSLEEQLRDDPQYAEATRSQMEKALREYTKQFIDPLECVDRYLKQFKREGLYRTISQGMSDPEGRWQAFIDYSNVYTRTFLNPRQRIELGIEEDEVGSIEEAAFNIIRLRAVPDMPKVHVIMRDLPKYCGTKDGKREVIKISEDVEPALPAKENTDENGNALSLEKADAKWAAKYKAVIVHRLKKARSYHESQRERETPIGLLQSALQKLAPEGMDIRSISAPDLKKARALAVDIQGRAREIESEIYSVEKEFKKLLKN
jgi:hypothetical protein